MAGTEDQPPPGDRKPEPAYPSVPHPFSYLTIAFTTDEFDLLSAAARLVGQTLVEFVREAALGRARTTR